MFFCFSAWCLSPFGGFRPPGEHDPLPAFGSMSLHSSNAARFVRRKKSTP
ncbi:hypothetical protein ACFPRL_05850 [Pseudoclavibacter helvolus]